MWAGASLVALSLVLTPAIGASLSPNREKPKRVKLATAFDSGMLGGFTPAASDPRLAAVLARRGFQPSGFSFTPSATSSDKNKAVRVAVRARSGLTSEATRTAVTAVTPTAYNLGAAIGWKRFALSGDVGRSRDGIIPGDREAAEVGVSYAGKKFATRVQVAAERAEGAQRYVGADQTYSVDLGGSYSIARNVDLTGGLRYKIQRDQLEPLVDKRLDSQAVYIGTAFRF